MQRVDEIFLALPAMRPRPSFLQTYRFGMTRGYVPPRFCTYVHSAKPNPHEFVMLGREGLFSAKFYCEK